MITTTTEQPKWTEIRSKIDAAEEPTIGGIAKGTLKLIADILENKWNEVTSLNRNSWPVLHLRPSDVPAWELPHPVEVEGTNIVVVSKEKVLENESRTIRLAASLNKLVTVIRTTTPLNTTARREAGLHHKLYNRPEVVSFHHSCEYLAKTKVREPVRKMAIILEECHESDLSNMTNQVLNKNLWNIVKNMCEILAMLSKEQLLHRDIRPENLFLIHSDGKLMMKLGNLACAGTVEDELRRLKIPDETLDCSSEYTPPEIINSQFLEVLCSLKTNVWSMGITLYEMIIGELPLFAGKNESQESVNETLNDFLIAENCLEALKNDERLRNFIFLMIRQMLVVDPKKRISGSELLKQFLDFNKINSAE